MRKCGGVGRKHLHQRFPNPKQLLLGFARHMQSAHALASSVALCRVETLSLMFRSSKSR